MTGRIFTLSTCLVAVVTACATAAALTHQDETAINAATQAYSNAWLTNQADAVLATLTPGAVLMPSGMEAVVGADNIRNFWWPPDGSGTTVKVMTQVVDEITGEGDMAVVRGHGTLRFVTSTSGRDESHYQRSTFVNVLRRQPTGKWLIALRMWSDLK
ncbi:MAG TPA: nuclear transport factor 2 family protein [Candidatus Krumholzibacteria bacterium]|nr:nuclear transport factor 2 family protein [Candidatus Krumholzibacteria bacterium]